MSSISAKQYAEELEAAAVRVAWRQWAQIGGSATSSAKTASMVDPEALILASLFLDVAEPRIPDVLFSWVEANAPLLSVQRLRNLTRDYPKEGSRRVEDFARQTRAIARDPKWKSLLGDDDGEAHVQLPAVRRAVPVSGRKPSALMLRLRLALGVGVKADVLAVVIGSKKSMESSELAKVLGYTPEAVRNATDALARAGFIVGTPGKQSVFVAPQKEWLALLEFDEAPRWVAWHQWYALVIDVILAVRASAGKTLSEYATDVHARNIFRRHETFFRIAASDLGSGAIRQSMGDYAETLQSLATWPVTQQ